MFKFGSGNKVNKVNQENWICDCSGVFEMIIEELVENVSECKYAIS